MKCTCGLEVVEHERRFACLDCGVDLVIGGPCPDCAVLRQKVAELEGHKRKMRHALVICRDYAQSAERWHKDLKELLKETEADLPTVAGISGLWANNNQGGQ